MRVLSAGNQALAKGFLELPQIIYADDPIWIPEEPESVQGSFSAANPWYADGESATFCIPGKARMALFHNAAMKNNDIPAAWFGYWETVGDEAADDAIFQAAAEWAKERGAKTLCGPINFSTFGNYRIRTRFEEGGVPFYGEPYNPMYYEGILDRLGFKRTAEAVTQITPGPIARQLVAHRGPELEKLREKGFDFRPMTHELWLDNLPTLHGLIETMFQHNWGYTPLSYEMFEKACGPSWIRKTDPVSSMSLYDPNDRLSGFFLAYPHWGPIITQGAKNRVPVSEIDYHKHFEQLKETGTVIGVPKTSAIHPDYQGLGLFAALAIAITVPTGDLYQYWYGALIGATKLNRKFGSKVSTEARWYAAYGKAI
jgi:GNAT superfamily N-acetyltransferase